MLEGERIASLEAEAALLAPLRDPPLPGGGHVTYTPHMAVSSYQVRLDNSTNDENLLLTNLCMCEPFAMLRKGQATISDVKPQAMCG